MNRLLRRALETESARRPFLKTAFCASIPLTWVFSMTASRSMGFPTYPRIPFYMGLGIGMILCALLSDKIDRYKPSHGTDASACAVLCAVSLAMCFWEHTPAVLICLYMLTAGTALAWLSLRWFAACCRNGIKDARNLVLAAFSISATVRLGLTAVSSAIPVASLCITAVLSLLAAKPSIEAPGPDRTSTAQRVQVPLRGNTAYILELVLCSIILGGTRNFLAEPQHQDTILVANYLLRIAVPIILLVFFSLHDHNRSYRPAQYAIVVLLFLLLALSIFGNPATSQVIARALLLFTWDFILLLMYLVALGPVFSRHVSPYVTLGTFRGVFELFLGIGMFLTMLANAAGDIEIIPTNIVLFLVGTIFLFSVNRLIIVISCSHADVPAPSGMQEIETVCRTLGKEQHLTNREIEIMSLICKGFSKGFIAEELGLSENTVRWHSKNLYEKLGIHSKQELLKMTEQRLSP